MLKNVSSYLYGNSLPGTVSFRDIVNTTISANYGWMGKQTIAPNRTIAMNQSLPGRFPGSTVNFSVQPGDHPVVSTGERNEFYQMFNTGEHDEDGTSGTQYYGVSIYLPSGWQDAQPVNIGGTNYTWAIACQLHTADNISVTGISPAFALDLSVVNGRYTLSQRGGDQATWVANNTQPYNTDLGAHMYDTWVDFLFEVTWAIDGTGYTAAWTRNVPASPLQQFLVGTGTPITPWNTPTLYSTGGVAVNHYWKRGLYRSPSNFTSSLYAGPLTRASTFADAALAAFGQYP